jgi:hypothetical protein
MGSADLPEPAAARQQNSYAFRSSALYSSSVTLLYARRVSAKLRAASMFYSIPLSLCDDANQLCVYYRDGRQITASNSVMQ